MNAKLLSFITAGTTFLSVVAMIGSANAASLSTKASLDSALTDIVEAPLNIQQFNSSLGHLDSVTIDFKSDLLGNASFVNKGTNQIPVTVDLSGEIDLTLNGQSLFSLTPESKSTYSIPTLKQNPNQPIFANGLTASIAKQSKTYTDSNFLQSFIGNGNLAFLFSAYATSFVEGSGNLASTIDTNADASLVVTYNYTPQSAPEPSVTFGIGLIAGLGLLSQRKSRFSRA